jgi:ATP-dependent protease Clp ATPase subunit
MHCFMLGREYWGIVYMGEIDKLGNPTDSNEVTETSMFTDVPAKLPKRFEGQIKALHSAALSYLAEGNSASL